METPGAVHLRSVHPVRVTVDRLQRALEARGVMIFARIDQQAAARAAGLEMTPTELLIFGDPRVGTPLMVRHPSLALDLPLKALGWEDAAGVSWLSYNAFEYLAERHGLEVVPFKPVETLLRQAAAV